MRLSIRNQLLLGFAATLLLTVVVSAVGISQAPGLSGMPVSGHRSSAR